MIHQFSYKYLSSIGSNPQSYFGKKVKKIDFLLTFLDSFHVVSLPFLPSYVHVKQTKRRPITNSLLPSRVI